MLKHYSIIFLTVVGVVIFYLATSVEPVCGCIKTHTSLTWQLGVPIPPYKLSQEQLVQILSVARPQIIGKTLNEIKSTSCVSTDGVRVPNVPPFACNIELEGQKFGNSIVMHYWIGRDVFGKLGLEFRVLVGEDEKFTQVDVENIRQFYPWASQLPASVKLLL